MNSLLFFSIACTLFCGTFWLISVLSGEQTHSARRIRAITSRAGTNEQDSTTKKRWKQTLQKWIRKLRVRVGMAENDDLRQRFTAAGLRSSDAVELYFGARMLGPVASILAGSFIHSSPFFWIATMAGISYLAPDIWLNRAIKRRRERIRRSTPDTIDLLVICVDAGLGLDQAMLRVGVELQVSHPEMNEELLQINREQRAGKPRMEAWQAMADRTKLDDIASFTSMLIQTEKFGTPIARALSTFADGMRLARRQRAEELAAKTTVKMIFPLVLFIFPSMFIVLLAPAIINIARGLTGLIH